MQGSNSFSTHTETDFLNDHRDGDLSLAHCLRDLTDIAQPAPEIARPLGHHYLLRSVHMYLQRLCANSIRNKLG